MAAYLGIHQGSLGVLLHGLTTTHGLRAGGMYLLMAGCTLDKAQRIRLLGTWGREGLRWWLRRAEPSHPSLC